MSTKIKIERVASLPNGRIILPCPNCGFNLDLLKFGWSKTVCGACRTIVENPVNFENLKGIETHKTNVMLSQNAREYIHTVSILQGVDKSKALESILMYSRSEFLASGGAVVKLEQKTRKKKVENGK